METQFCSKCGSKLIVAATKFDGYNVATGKVDLLVKLKCPNKRWWFDGHDSADKEVLTNEDTYSPDMKRRYL